MCELCVKEEYPDRDTLCVEQGSYMINFVKCSSCGQQGLRTSNRKCNDSEEEELITYEHVCSSCEHVIAQHEYTFKVDGDFQIYEMSCLLCGSAEDQRSIMPVDPRGPAM
ncbi:churchill isoform X1 [Aplysia californica]|uniref:Protein Churchill n=1 Tax=Aplysia californica TaxID=6500 RepID=A1XP45_APLCA|nr:churchill [Aplysia californica]XP_035829521.1 churchill isoform X1 [Aplysia californica]XP_035829522.1 churchill isoform X1 [Aplysia californica]XP_035829525.1 churchill isoform X1 [Aplysia californica]ABF18969.1 churchill [Aplysia californica]